MYGRDRWYTGVRGDGIWVNLGEVLLQQRWGQGAGTFNKQSSSFG